jgi:hypothetical protein
MRKIALISEHASPIAPLGGVNNGGQNVYVAHIARNLAALGYVVDIFTRKDHPSLPDVKEWLPGVQYYLCSCRASRVCSKRRTFSIYGSLCRIHHQPI